jgi:hypothetical protein
MKCDNCTEKCPQEELACEIAKGRMYATNEVVRLQKELKEIKAKAIDEIAEAIRSICYKYPIGTDADTNELLYGHEDGTWHNLLDDVAEQMKGE